MYGTIFRMRPKAGRVSDLAALSEEWNRTRGVKLEGTRGHYVLRPTNRPDELIGVAVFADRATYLANANAPEQHEWYVRIRELLEADPSWEDGDYIVAFSGNPDAARLIADNFAAFNARDPDRAARTVAPQCELLDVPSGSRLTGPAGLRQDWQRWYTAFPDAKVEVLSIAASDDGTVVTEFIGRGTHNGPLAGPDGRQVAATGRAIQHRFCEVATVSGGQITSQRLYYDLAGLLAQVGIGG